VFEVPLLKVIRAQGETIVVVCDRELVGKTLRKRDMKLEVKASFYNGREASVEECLAAIRGATIANLVGSIVKHALRAGIVEERGVIRFQRVPHAQLVRM
jgi:hypothetical protein